MVLQSGAEGGGGGGGDAIMAFSLSIILEQHQEEHKFYAVNNLNSDH